MIRLIKTHFSTTQKLLNNNNIYNDKGYQYHFHDLFGSKKKTKAAPKKKKGENEWLN